MDARSTADANANAVTIDDIREAAQRLRGIVHRTPVVTSRTLDEMTGCSVYFKCENLQRMGAFKFRGAYNRISRFSPEQKKGGVVAFSSGNHAQGVALACKLLGIPAVIVMPEDAPKAKVEATKGYGAQVVFYDRHRSHRAEIAEKLCAERGATLVPPFDDVHILAGAGTAALELLEDVPDLDTIVTPVGGGGLLSGTSIAAHAVNPAINIFGVEPETGNDMQQSVARGEIVHIDVPRTIADGLQTQAPGRITFPIVKNERAEIVTVSDDELRDAMRFAFERMKIVMEPSGAAGLAALMTGKIRGGRIGVIVSGGNVDLSRFAELSS